MFIYVKLAADVGKVLSLNSNDNALNALRDGCYIHDIILVKLYQYMRLRNVSLLLYFFRLVKGVRASDKEA